MRGLPGIVFDINLVRVGVGRQGGDHLYRFVIPVEHVMNLAGFDVDHLTGDKVVDSAVHNYVHLAFQNEEVFLHDVVVVCLEILPGLELDDGKIHPGTLHQVLRAAVSEAVFLFVFMNDIHISSSKSIYWQMTGQRLLKSGRGPHIPGDTGIAQGKLRVIYLSPGSVHLIIDLMGFHIRLKHRGPFDQAAGRRRRAGQLQPDRQRLITEKRRLKANVIKLRTGKSAGKHKNLRIFL